MYILVIGVNEYANSAFNLRYAVPDVEAIGNKISLEQSKLIGKQYAESKVVTLTNELATKANIVNALKKFAGVDLDPMSAIVPELAKIKQAQPEDGLIIYFAGHGQSDKDRFYLIPHDGIPATFTGTGNASPAEQQRLLIQGKSLVAAGELEQLFRQSLSDLDLEQLLEAVNAGKVLMVIDACNSGQALEAEEKRRGPMNSRGLAQLAYEKGMNILTASLSFQSALESKKLNHGLLTFALLEGMEKGDKNNDQAINDREWLEYGNVTVPLLQGIKEKERLLVQGKNAKPVTQESDVQIPRIFYRCELESIPLVIALVK